MYQITAADFYVPFLGPWMSAYPHLLQHPMPFHVLTLQAKDWVRATELVKLTTEGKGNGTEPYSTLKAGHVLDSIKGQKFRWDGAISAH